MNQLTLLSLPFVIFAVVMLFADGCFASPDYVTITLPEKVLRQSVQDALPIHIDSPRDLVQGSLVLDSIDRFELGENRARVHGVILGKDIVLLTRIGDQEIRLTVGEVRLPLTCDFFFRFDPEKKNLYITPRFPDSAEEISRDRTEKIQPLLALLNNREYPVSLDSLQTIQTNIGKQKLSIAIEKIDIHKSPSQLVLKMVPKLSKTD